VAKLGLIDEASVLAVVFGFIAPSAFGSGGGSKGKGLHFGRLSAGSLR
jgi:hypothetical protein